MKKYIFLLIISSLTLSSFAQKERKFIREGNRYYKNATADTAKVDTTSFQLAETAYRKALDVKSDDFTGLFNIGDALFKQGKIEEAQNQFEEILEAAPTKEDKANLYFNIGNTLLAQQKLDASIAAFKNSLRNKPSDLMTIYNLEFARKMKEQQQQQQDQQNQQEPPPDPSEYAKELKKTAEQLIAERRYMEAYSLMKQGEKEDETVAAYQDFTERIRAVIQISDFKQ